MLLNHSMVLWMRGLVRTLEEAVLGASVGPVAAATLVARPIVRRHHHDARLIQARRLTHSNTTESRHPGGSYLV
jgi:hypothetical protein